MFCSYPLKIKLKNRPHYPTRTSPYGVTWDDVIEVPCGRCMACRIQKTKEWSVRLLHELNSHEDSVFLTLTYDDNHLPKNNTLVKKHVQDYLKRVRKQYRGRIKYFFVGEYGEKSGRAHYHAIIFGIGKKDEKVLRDNWHFCDKTYGIVVGSVTWDSCKYVASYVQKKAFGLKAKEIYEENGQEPPFQIQSLGMGYQWAIDNKEQIKKNGFIRVNGIRHSIPRYYINKLGLSNDSEFMIKAYENRLLQEEATEEDWTNRRVDADRLQEYKYKRGEQLNNNLLKRDEVYKKGKL